MWVVVHGQEIRAINALIWTMKISPNSNGHWPASSCRCEEAYGMCHHWILDSIFFTAKDSAFRKVKHTCYWKNTRSQSSIGLPNKILKIEESLLQVLDGHSGDVMDLVGLIQLGIYLLKLGILSCNYAKSGSSSPTSIV